MKSGGQVGMESGKGREEKKQGKKVGLEIESKENLAEEEMGRGGKRERDKERGKGRNRG